MTERDVERLKEATYTGLLRSIPLLVQRSPVDTGQYASSWGVERRPEEVLIGNYAPHAPIIEYGARPFTPPIGPLLAWAKRVLQDPVTPSNPQDPSDYSEEVRALAFAVQKKISERGMPPRQILEKATPDIIQNIIEEYRRGR